MKINSEATRERCRAKYGSVAACYRAFGVGHRIFYAVVAGSRGQGGGGAISSMILERLEREDLLVLEEGTGC